MDFRFQQFGVQHSKSTMKVGTDAVLLGAWARVGDDNSILDVGCGCGIISLMLAQRSTGSQISAIDIDRDSIDEAKKNFSASEWGDRLHASHNSYLDMEEDQFDHIISNPPFFTGDKKSIYPSRTKSRHTVYLTHFEFILKSLEMIHEKSRISVILPAMIAPHFISMAEQKDLFLNRKCKVSPFEGKVPNRVLMEFSQRKAILLETSIFIYNDDSTRSEKYHELAKDYFL